ncbi:solute carrier family 44 protein member 2 [Cavenderia fasciculata]|uniref:Choline transporter-like protein n=1 Tax=Cavenderia fasciculata TaxID=261658 RepID=F4QER6_CACFS|nr:solute carrier family 44 protein member 2 [Cavenderia fasciculata]EGG13327.1 solute carrier family 44 protein member 2 [Cavenderia fasciculata]|eukprot:XP_004350030.1 solute carrier family 44 protein member 2 [Cavenderia fasciculata]
MVSGGSESKIYRKMGKGHDPRGHEVIKNKGVYDKRKCHDCLFLLLFLAFWGGMIAVAVIAVKEGNPLRLIYGTDENGNICGVDNIADGVLPANKSANFVDNKYVYYIVYTGNLISARPVCVSQCPNETHLIPDNASQLVCSYNVTPAMDQLYPNGTCAGTYASRPIFNRCIPTVLVNATDTLLDEVFKMINSKIDQDTSVKLLSDMVESWKYLIMGAFVALGLGFLWIFLLRYFAGLITWSTVLGVLGCLSLLAIQVYYQWQDAEDEYYSIPPAQRLSLQYDNVQALKVIFIIICVIGGILAFIILALWRRIMLSIAIIKESSRAVGTMPSIFFFPLFIFAWICAFVIYWVIIGFYLGTAGTPEYDENGVFLGYIANDTIRYMQIYHFFGLLWTITFILAVNQCTIAGSIALWYWVMDKKDTPYFPVWKSFGRVLRYHLGSLALGSLILAIIKFIRYVLQYVEKKFKGKEAFLARFIVKCLQCLFWCFEKFIKFLDKNAYIMISIYGYSFCKGAKRGFELILSNVLRVAAVNMISGFLLFLGRVLITVMTVGIAFYALQRVDDLTFYVIPVILIGVIAYAIATGFMSVYDMTIDTMLLCFCEDSSKNDGSAERPYFMSKRLKKFVDGGYTGSCC